MRCKACGGRLFYLGALGFLRWFRCEACGLDQCRKTRVRKGKVKA